MDKKEYRDIEELVYEAEEAAEFAEPEEVVLAALEDEPLPVTAEEEEPVPAAADEEDAEAGEAAESEEAEESPETDAFGYEDKPQGLPCCGGCAPILMNTPGGGRIVVGVRFRSAGKIYYFSPGDLPIRKGTHVIVETSRGVEFGTASADPIEVDEHRYSAPLRQVIRIATPEDEEKVRTAREKEKEARRICQEKIRARGLDMKLIDAEYTFDGSKILFYFTADGRVDFRDLVKDLAGIFRTRIELRQIGVRDETKILGGYGSCGRPLCCHTYLSDFVPVSIKMAKEQNLSLNPTKISGVCGRLMCCLKNEEDTYEELNKNLPRLGDEVEGSDGLRGEVQSVNVLRQTVRILVEVDDEKEIHEYGADELTILRRRRRGSARKKQGGKKTRTRLRRNSRSSALTGRRKERRQNPAEQSRIGPTEIRLPIRIPIRIPVRMPIPARIPVRHPEKRKNRKSATGDPAETRHSREARTAEHL